MSLLQEVRPAVHRPLRRHPGSQRDVVEETLSLNGRSFEVTGIAPSGISGLLARGIRINFWILSGRRLSSAGRTPQSQRAVAATSGRVRGPESKTAAAGVAGRPGPQV